MNYVVRSRANIVVMTHVCRGAHASRALHSVGRHTEPISQSRERIPLCRFSEDVRIHAQASRITAPG